MEGTLVGGVAVEDEEVVVEVAGFDGVYEVVAVAVSVAVELVALLVILVPLGRVSWRKLSQD